MNTKTLNCTGCGCLCDDIQIESKNTRPAKIENACARGAAYLQAAFRPERRPKSNISGRSCSNEEAVMEAVRLLSKARRRLIFGMDDSTLETQTVAIELAKKLGATLDNASSYSYGTLVERIIKRELPSCPLSQVKDQADLLLYWGANPTATHPRHLSKFTYYAYRDFDPAGWFPKVTLACIDVRQTELATMSKPTLRIKPGSDHELFSYLLGESPPINNETKQLSELIKKSHFCVIFCGLGLVHSLNGDFSGFSRMIHTLSQSTRMAVIPMIAQTNMFGFNQLLHKQTGYVNQVNFANGISHGREFSLLEQIRNRTPDCILIIGSDPLSTLPHSLTGKLDNVDIICLDHYQTLTTEIASVVIPTAVTGVECGGHVVRMDGEDIALMEQINNNYPTETEILEQLLEKVRP